MYFIVCIYHIWFIHSSNDEYLDLVYLLAIVGNQLWMFIGRTDAEAAIIWPPDVKRWLIGKDPDAGKDWRQKEKREAEDEMIR